MIKLTSVYAAPGALQTLYELLAEREPHQSISHKEMPTFEQHRAFVGSVPYLAWYLIEKHGTTDAGSAVAEVVGAIYLSKQREIGIGIFKSQRGKGYGKAAVRELMTYWPGRYLANVNPANKESWLFFLSLGGKVIQHTFELGVPRDVND